jgi:hypothetical protein
VAGSEEKASLNRLILNFNERSSGMKVVAVLMVLVGVTLGWGAIPEFRFYGPEAHQFWVGVFTAPAGMFFALAGVLLWLRGVRVRRAVLLAALLMFSATIAATGLGVMGPPATLMGVIGVLVVAGWLWRTRTIDAEHLTGVNGSA